MPGLFPSDRGRNLLPFSVQYGLPHRALSITTVIVSAAIKACKSERRRILFPEWLMPDSECSLMCAASSTSVCPQPLMRTANCKVVTVFCEISVVRIRTFT